MSALLRDYVVLGLTTNREFLLDVIESEAFAAGDTDTAFIGRLYPDWQPDRVCADGGSGTGRAR